MTGPFLDAEAVRRSDAPFTGAVRIDHGFMSPAIPKGSVAFLAPPGFDGEGRAPTPRPGILPPRACYCWDRTGPIRCIQRHHEPV